MGAKVKISDTCTMNQFVVRRAEPNDYKAVAEISRKTFYESWRYLYSEEDLQIYMAEVFSEEQIKKDLEAITNIFLLAETDEKIIGYTKLCTDSILSGDNLADWMLILLKEFSRSKAMEMERLYVLKEYHKQKAGKQLMDESISIARKQDFDWLWLGVSPDNLKAMAFYKSYGFIQVGTKPYKIGNTVDFDYLMKLRI